MAGHRIVVAVAVALIVPLAACGGDDGGGDVASLADWCAAAERVNEVEEALDDALFDPAQLEVQIGAYRSAIASAAELAPDEVSADVNTLADGVAQLDEALALASYNLLDVDFSEISELDEELDAAAERVQAYNQRVCGFEPMEGAVDGDDDSTFDPAAGSVRDQLAREFEDAGMTESEARCVADNIDVTDLVDDPDGGIDAIIEVFEQCEIPLSRLVELGEIGG